MEAFRVCVCDFSRGMSDIKYNILWTLDRKLWYIFFGKISLKLKDLAQNKID